MYVGLWAALGVVSLGYMGAAALTVTPGPATDPHPILVENSAIPTRESQPPSAGIDATLQQRLADKRRSLAEVVDELQAPTQHTPQAPRLAEAPEPDDRLGSGNQNGPGVLASKAVRTTTIAGLQRPSPSVNGADTVASTASEAPLGVSILNGAPGASIAAEATAVAKTQADQAVRILQSPAAAVQLARNAGSPVERKVPPLTTGSIKPPPLPIRGPARPKLKPAAIAAKIRPTTAPTPTGFGATNVARAEPARRVAAATPPAARRLGANESPAMGVRLSVAPSIDGLRLQWTLLRERHGTYLGGLSARYIQTSRNGAPANYELVAGPLSGAVQALELCQDVSRSGTRCVVGDFVGNAL